MTEAIRAPRTATRVGVLVAAVLLCLMTVFGVSSAQAHDELISSTPASGEVLKTAPKSLVLTFSGDIKKIGTILELSDAKGNSVDTTFTIDRRDVTVTPSTALANGKYTLAARVVSSDGHPIAKDIAFQVSDPAAVASSAPATASAPGASTAPSATPSAQPSAEASDTATPVAGMPAGLVWTIVALAGAGMIALVILKVRRQAK
ncbi:copper resistance protein CopC [Paeniglutamicibacter psychrophenolicus]|uniref:Methionine-rich copper-binding protein CopC n=1 Tax=Paeniglutamicibacter psychrophenolicus TaxID=257454 RepID=A0ABS4WBT6_9MICC|nr:copper resistance protein CopC [Paeniglutamicibacter psychrophenolicus]MBP2373671.1 methionine-rich copper-binding protein CopC [Paeniglutamicibacter psychrophenolicus]